MRLLPIKKYHINSFFAKKKLSHILSQTRRRTSAIVKFWKHLWQIIWERIPVLSPLQELIAGKWLISEVSIRKYSISRWWRIIIVFTEWIFAYILISHGNEIIKEAKENIQNIIFNFIMPQHLSIETVLLMIVIGIWTIGYYGMIKPWDLQQAIKEHKEEHKEY